MLPKSNDKVKSAIRIAAYSTDLFIFLIFITWLFFTMLEEQDYSDLKAF